jgi:CheY-like chemotaxis protein
MTQATPCEILLAEDNAADVALVREALKEHDVACDLRIVSDGAQAIAFLRSLDSLTHQPCPDLLLVDLHLPKHDGADILRALRSTERCARTPVIVMSSSGAPADREMAEKHAALHYFKKPSSLAEFLLLGGVVKGILDGKRSASQHPPGAGGGVGVPA